MGRVVVVGSVNADYVMRVGRLPRAGETVTGGRLTTHLGGKGANQAHAAARLGATVCLIAAVGRDAAAQAERTALVEDGVGIDGLIESDGPTGAAVIMVEASGDNRIAVAGGANDLLDAESVRARIGACGQHGARGRNGTVRPARRAHGLGTADVVLTCLEVPLEAVIAAAAAAAAAGSTMVINPAPGMPLPPETVRGAVLTPNESEVRQLVPAARDVPSAVSALLGLGARAVVVTMGEDGAMLFRAAAPAVHLPAPRVNVVDTVGAGDAFNGALAAALADGLGLMGAAELGVLAGAAACTGAGARAALPRRADLRALRNHTPSTDL